MVYVTAGLLLVAAVAVLNLLLTVGVVRRLREHTRMFAAGASAEPPAPPKPGHPVGQFVADTVEGETVSRDTLPAGSLVAFLSPSCAPCQEQLPAFVRHLRESGRPRTAALVVILDTAEAAAEMIDALGSMAIVACEPPPATDLRAAFGVWSSPIAVLVDGATITDVFIDLTKLPASNRAVDATVPAIS